MPGRLPKDPKLRQRTNKVSTRAMLIEGKGVKTPELPKHRAWLQQTTDWWRDIWRSPMAPEFLQSDIHGLYILAELVDTFWTEPSTGLAMEIRLQRQCFGLTPIDRRRLQWEVQKVEEKTDRSRSTPAATTSRRRIQGDVRAALTLLG